jgi:hypothetical protein
MPVFDGQLRRDQGGVPLGPIIHDFQQIVATVGFQRLQCPVVQLCGATHNSTVSVR